MKPLVTQGWPREITGQKIRGRRKLSLFSLFPLIPLVHLFFPIFFFFLQTVLWLPVPHVGK